jgi:hypothetical protein
VQHGFLRYCIPFEIFFHSLFGEFFFKKNAAHILRLNYFSVLLRRSPGNFLSRISDVDDEAGFFYFFTCLASFPTNNDDTIFAVCCVRFSISFLES